MTTKPTAIGYLRRDISGISQNWHETQIRSLAQRLGYTLSKTIVFGPRTHDPIARLITAARNAAARAVITPCLWHFSSHLPAELIAECDLITITPHHTYTRRPPPPVGDSLGSRTPMA
ncbi:hypothetical protein [Nocardia sp. CNY236]|uniref:hypothetical protein n=1 Tax=Nocardia sp. CNY236 TaxID=1169152 RepID=UPI000421C28F|nr:hypothetical protein [Nocardia sp. CNY236]